MTQQAVNPYLPSWEYIPDAEPRVFGGRVYVFGSHDRFGGDVYCLNDYVGWSAPVENLADWCFEGVIYRKVQDPLNPEGEQRMNAPDVVQGPDGRYYLFYALHREPVISVAVCDAPVGEYQFYGHVQTPDGQLCGKKHGDVYNFDPGVLVEDGRVFLYTGFAPEGKIYDLLKHAEKRIDAAYCIELEPDMLTLVGEAAAVIPGPHAAEGTSFEAHPFFEASSPRRIGDRYYLIYSSSLSHELCYAISDRPDGGFTFGGTIVSIGDIGFEGNEKPTSTLGNTHGGLAEIAGNWYVFYHRHTNGTPYSRQAAAERIEIRDDGSIPQVEVTSCGLNGGPLAGTGRYEARIACNLANSGHEISHSKAAQEQEQAYPYFTQSGEDRVGQGDQYLANLRDGAWAGFKYFDFQDESRITVSMRGTGRGTVEISPERGGASIASVPVRPDSDWYEESADFAAPQGVSPLNFTYRGTGSIDVRAFEIS
ncbi:family 43 glycosylhydrolase [Nocardiopsis tropica]|uniref:Family 43 glycosylhydrolase n=1 Tax=Nocardiopsis tropica TaxID=109330 RepID=A0ABU7KKK9_9ACTN|nr:family 43 glycosylhydrolase [Nocardiopsis umidischolae]MEE2049826.1 family 43 glycosylhydrolase [Nocardiopsis umidischolae]